MVSFIGCTFLDPIAPLDGPNSLFPDPPPSSIPVIINCPEDMEQVLTAGTQETTISWPKPLATAQDNTVINNPDSIMTDTTVIVAEGSGSSDTGDFPIGPTTVTYTFTDAVGNSAECKFVVTIIEEVQPMVDKCPTDLSVEGVTGAATVYVEWDGDVTAQDMGGVTLQGPTGSLGTSLGMQGTGKDGGMFVAGTTETVTYVLTNGVGSTNCDFEVEAIAGADPVISGCPIAVTESLVGMQTAVVVAWTDPLGVDGVDGPLTAVVTPQGQGNGAMFGVGTITVTYTFTDAVGNSAECSFDVTVTQTADTTPPVIDNCPADMTVATAAGDMDVAVSWTAPSVSDDVDTGLTATLMTSPTTGLASGDRFPVGVTTVSYDAVDSAGNVAVTCSFDVTVTQTADTTPPVIDNCPADMTVATAAGDMDVAVSWTAPSVSDNVDTGLTATLSTAPTTGLASGDRFPVGVTTVSYDAVDSAGNVAVTCSFDVTVTQTADTTPPVIDNCPADMTVATAVGDMDIAVSWTAPSVSDNVDTGLTATLMTSPTTGLASGDRFPVGVTTVSYDAVDSAGNVAVTCSFDVTVTQTADTTPPVIDNCPADMTVATAAGDMDVAVSWTAPSVSDNVDTGLTATLMTSPTTGLASGDRFPVGVTTVSYDAVDSAGNAAVTCSFEVTVTMTPAADTTPPVIANCPADMTVATAAGDMDVAVSWTAPSVSDNVDTGLTATLMTSPTTGLVSGDRFPVGVTTVSYDAMDSAGNVAVTCSFDVTVTQTADTTPPVIDNCPADMTVATAVGDMDVAVSWTAPSVSDNVDTGLTATLMTSPTTGLVSGDRFPVGVTTVSYDAVDSAGNVAVTCSFDVTVTQTADTTPPVIDNCPADMTVATAVGDMDVAVSWTAPSVSDNVDTGLTATLMTSPTTGLVSGGRFPVGVTTVSYDAVDSAGNVAVTCSFDVTVTQTADTTPPVIDNCPADMTVATAAGDMDVAVSWTAPSVSDNVDTGLTATLMTSPTTGLASGDRFPVGVTTVSYDAVDSAGNVAVTCSFDVTVTQTADTIAPVIDNCPADMTVATAAGDMDVAVSWTAPSVSDNVDTGLTATLMTSPTTGLASGDRFPVGVTTVSYDAVDSAGNAAVTCSFEVTVTMTPAADTTPPVIANCPANMTVATAVGDMDVAVSWTAPSVSDDVDTGLTATLMTSPTTGLVSGDRFPVGVTTVSYDAVDSAGNVAVTCEFEVVVTMTADTTPPVIDNCPADMTVATAAGDMDVAVSWTAPSVRDNVDTGLTATLMTSPTTGLASGDRFPVGVTTVSYDAVDSAGNVAVTCSFDVTVTQTADTIAPVIDNCPADMTVATAVGDMDVAVSWTAPSVSDNVDTGLTATLMTSPTTGLASGDRFPVGVTTVSYDAMDSAGNVAVTCSFEVVVTMTPAADTTPPVIDNCPADMTVATAVGDMDVAVSWTAPSVSDNVDTGLTATLSTAPTTGLASGDRFPVGVTTVSYDAVDSAGNVAVTCSFDVTVTQTADTTPPVIDNCPADMTVATAVGDMDIAVSWTAPSVSDNVDTGLTATLMTSPTTGLASGDRFPVGVTTVSYDAVDSAGNVAVTCSFDVTVTQTADTTPPVIDNCPADMTVATAAGDMDVAVSWTAPSVSDNVDTGLTATLMTSPTTGLASGDRFPVGVTTVSYDAVDSAGNAAVTCSFEVTVTMTPAADTTPPVIANCPADMTVATAAGDMDVAVSWTAPSVSDDVDTGLTATLMTSPTTGLVSGDRFPVGVTTVSYDAVDSAGNVAVTCEFEVVVTMTADTTPPVIDNCPADMTVATAAGDMDVAVSWTAPSVRDNVDTGLTATLMTSPTTGLASGDRFPVGVTTVSYDAMDSAGNVAVTCSFDVTVTQTADTIAPVIDNCPADMTVATAVGDMDVAVSWTAPSVSDNVDTGLTATLMTSPTTGLASGDRFPVGVTTVSYDAMDSAGNVAVTCSFEVVVTMTPAADTTPPVIDNCPADMTVATAVGDMDVAVSWTAPSVSDNVDTGLTATLMTSPTTGLASGDRFPVGVTTVSYDAVDSAGNAAVTCSFEVTVTMTADTTPPVIANCPADMTVATAVGDMDVAVSWTAPSVSDNVDTGLTATLMTSPTTGLASGDRFPVGVTTVSYDAVDSAGNVAVTCSFDVTVTQTADTTPPVIDNCPADMTVATAAGDMDVAVSWTAPSVSDNVDTGLTATLMTSPTTGLASGDRFPVGVTTVSYDAVDSAGNVAVTCSFEVVVTMTADTTPPVIANCPADMTVATAAGDADVAVSWTAPSVSDNVDTGLTATLMTSPTTGLASGDRFPVGVTTVSYDAMDSAGNAAVTCSFEVVVTMTPAADTTPPVIDNCPADMMVATAAGDMDVAVSWTAPSVSDNVDTGLTATLMTSPTTGLASGDRFPVGVTTVSYDAMDSAGNVAVTCSFDVTVTQTADTTAPVIDNCPADMMVATAAGDMDVAVSWTAPSVSDNVDTGLTATLMTSPTTGLASGDRFPVGVTTVSYDAVDSAGNVAVTCEFEVVVTMTADTTPPVIDNCPADMTVATAVGDMDVAVSWTAPSVSDNVDTGLTATLMTSPTTGLASGDRFPVGVTTVSYDAVDSAGNVAVTCSFDVTVTQTADTTPPVIDNCPADMTVATAAGDMDVAVSWTAPSVSDNVDTGLTATLMTSPTTGLASGDRFPVGVTTVSYDAVDSAGNVAVTCSFEVVVTMTADTTPPVIANCPADMTVATAAGDADVAVSWTAPSVSDNVDTGLTATLMTSPTTGLASGDRFPVGVTTVSYDAMDSAGNAAVTCSFEVVVTMTPAADTTPPVIDNCPADMMVATAAGDMDVAVSWTAPSVSDNVDTGLTATLMTSPTTGLASGDRFPVGVTTVSYDAMDSAGNVAVTCSFDVTVTQTADTTAPVIDNCPADMMVATAAGDMDVAVSWTAPSVSDNVDTGLTATLMTSPTTGLASGDRFPVGVTTVSYDAVDSAGNVAVTCEFEVVVTMTADTTPPVIDNCPADMTVATAVGDMDVAVSWTAPSVSDNVDTGLTATLMTSPTTGLASGDRFPVGVTTVSYDAMDSAGNAAVTCSFDVTVTQTADTTPPVIANCPADMTVATAAGDMDVAVSWTAPSVSDNVDTGLTATLMTSPTTGLVSGDRFPVGVTTVSYDAVDSAGNVAVTCSFEVTVTMTADTTPPVIANCPADMTVATAAGDMDVAVSWTAPSVRDNVDTGLTATLMTSPTTGLASGDRFPVGVTTVSYDAVDSAGNAAVTCSFEVTVTMTPAADTTPPVIDNCPADMTVATAAGDMDVAVSWTAPSVSDNVDTGLTATLMTSPTTGLVSGDRFPVGVTTVSYDAMDSAGNAAVTCSFEVVVTMTADTTPPVIANCPADMTVATAAGDADVAVSWTAPSVRDNVDTGLTATLMTSPTTGLVSGDRFPVGVTTVSYDAVDSAGNVAVTCSFDVTVTQTADTTPPVIDNCPADMMVATAAGDMDVAVSWTAPSVSDNVDTGLTATLMTSPTTGLASGDRFPVGVTTVSYDAVDSAGNAAVTCSFEVTVTMTPAADTTPPVIANCPADMTVATAVGDMDVAVSWTAPSVSDNVDTGLTATLMTSPTTGLASGDRFPVGVTTVSYDAVDSAGNVAVTCSFDVTVTQTADTTPPVIDNCPADMTVATAAGDVDVAVSWTAPSVSDNVDTGLTATLMTSPTTGLASGDRFPVGVTTVSYDAVDSAGNVAVTCSFDVTVTQTADTTPPVIDNCPADMTVATAAGDMDVAVSWTAPSVSDNVDTGLTATLMTSPTTGLVSGDRFPVGVTTVSYDAVDSAGNVAVTCSFDVTVTQTADTTPPVIDNCPADMMVATAAGDMDVAVSWTAPSVSDNVDTGLTATLMTSPTTGLASGDRFPVGVTTVSYDAVDSAGNTAVTCSFEVTVTMTADTTPPVIANCPADMTVATAAGDNDVAVSWTAPSVRDNVDTGLTATLMTSPTTGLVSGDRFPVGVTTVSYDAVDSAGNVAVTCSFDVTVTQTADTTPPVIDNCPADMTVATAAGDMDVAVSWTAPSVRDNVDTGLTATLMTSPTTGLASGDRFPVGVTTVSYDAVDSAGNVAVTCSFDVTVTQTADTIAPVIDNCPADMTVATAAGDMDVAVSWTAPSVSDNVDTGLTATLMTSPTTGLASGDRFPVGVTTVSYDAVDSAGNAAVTCSFEVTVTMTPAADTTPPVIANCPADMTVATAVGDMDVAVSWTAPSVSDNVDTGLTATLMTSPTTGLASGDRFPVGVTTVSYDAVDSAGNVAVTCSFDVTVTQTADTTPPVIDNCPADMTVATAAGDVDVAVSWTAPSVSDNVDTGLTATLMTSPTTGLASGDRFPVGVTTVSYDAVDSAGNVAVTCSFDVTVTQTADTIAPVIDNCPADMTVATAAGDMDVAVSWTAPSVSDNVDTGLTATLMTSPTTGLASGDRFPVGVTTVSYDAVDSAGNAAVTCSFEVTVTMTPAADTTPPVIANCPADMTVATAVGDMDVAVSWTAPSVSDNVDTGLTATLMTSPTTGLASGDRFPVGVTTVSYDAVDSAGNVAVTCSFDVTVTQTADTTPPVIDNCPADMTVATAAGDVDVAVSWTAPSVSDNVDTGLTATLMTSPTTGLASGDRFPVGVTTVSYDAVDSAGNVAVTCSFDVTVTQTADTTPPVIDNCPADMMVATAAGDMDVAVSWTAPSVSDNVDTGLTATLMTSPTTGLVSGDRFPVGVTTVSYDAVDSAGNVAVTCEFEVVVTMTADTTPPVIDNCPADMTVATAAGDMDVAVSWTAPSVRDNVDTGLTATLMTSPTTGLASGDRFPVGVTTVSYDAVDSAGNVAVTCSFDVTVTQTADTIAPVIDNCPADMTVATAAGDMDVAVSWTAPSVSDNVDTGLTATLMTSPTTGLVSGDRFPVGVTTVSYDAVDSAGNAAVTCSFEVTVTMTPAADTTPPVIANCPADMTVATAVGDMDVAVSWTAPSVSDNVDMGLTATLMTSPTTGLVSGDRFPVGVTTVSYDAVDSAGNVAVTCSFDVTVTQTADTTPPVIDNCPADMTVATAAGDMDVAVSWTAPSVSDNVDTGLTATLMTSPTTGLASGDRFPVGVTTVSYDAMDSAGNAAVTCSFEVVVTMTADTTPPVIANCPADMTVATAAGDADVAVSWTAPSVSDNVDTGLTATLMTSPTTGLVSGDRFPVGVTTVSYDAVDSAGNVAVTCSFDVTVTQTADTTPPVIDNCPADMMVATAAGDMDVAVSWTAPSVSDNVDTGLTATLMTSPTTGLASGDRFPVGVTTVSYDAVDSAGNTAVTCSFEVTVTMTADTTPPVIANCPADMTVATAAGDNDVAVSWTAPSVRDNVDTGLTATLMTSPTTGLVSGDRFPVGVTTVSYDAVDSAGNVAVTCSFDVTVTQTADTTPPVIDNCPADMTVATAAGDMDVAVSWTAPSVSDNVDTGLTATLMTSPTTGLASGDRFPVGVTTVSYDAVDSAGNVAVTCSFDVTVTQTADTIAPVIDNCPADMTVATAAGDMDVAVSWTAPSVSDNVDTGLTATLMTSPTTGLASGDRFPVGVTTVSYDAVDSAGNVAVTCSFDVTVTQTADTTPPVIDNCPADMTVATAVGDMDVAVSWTAPSVSDNVDTGLTATLMTSPTTGLASGDRFPVGVTTVSYDAVDSAGNVAVTCSFDVTVTQTADTIAPVIDNCPADMTVATAAGDMDVAVSWTAPSVSDNVDTGLTATLMTSPTTGLASGDRFPVGVTTVSYDAVDSAGNAAVTCSFEVTVTMTPAADTTPPVIANCPADMTVATAVGDMDVAVSWTAPSVSDNVDTGLTATLMTSPTTGLASGDRFPVGVTTVSYDAVDSAGNVAVTCSFDVTVTQTADTTPPVIANCPADMTVATAAGDVDVAVSWTAPSVSDNVDTGLTATLMTSPTTGLASGDRFPVGVTTVSYDAVDSAGNVAVTCSFDVTVTQTADTTPPVIDNCPADMTVATAAGDMDVAVSWTAPSVSDNVDTGLTATLMTSPTTGLVSGDRFPVGVTTVSYDAVDSAGNVAVTCSFDVTVTQTADTTPPVIDNCPADMMVATAAGDMDVAVSWTAPSVSDNVDTGLTATLMTSPTTGLASGDRFPVGVTTVSYDAVDSAGNTAVTCSFEVTVTMTADTTPPVIANCPADMTVATAAGDNDVAVSWTAPSVRDNVDTGLTATLMTSPTTGLVSGDRFPVGVTTVSYDAVDSAGNVAVTCSFDVTVTQTADTTPPVIDNCPADMTVATAAGDMDVAVSWTAPSVRDNVDTGLTATLMTSPTTGLASGDRFPVGVTTVSYDAVDSAGNVAVTCSFDVTVTQTADTIAPVIDNCPADMTVATAAGDMDVAVSWTAPSVSDNVDTGLTATLMTSPTTGLASGDRFPVGVTTVSYDAVDSAGNAAVTCSFEVTVTMTPAADTTPPVIANCPADMTVATAVGDMDVAVSWTAPSVSDNVDTGLTATLMTSPTTGLASGDRFPVGVTTVSYDAVDSAGNVAVTCSFDVTVTQTADTTPPVIDNCPADMTVATAAGDVDVAVSWTAPSVSDNVDTGLTATLMTSPTTGLASGDRFPVGVTTVSYDAVDSAGNVAVTCSFDVTVTQTADTTPPVIDNCPADMTVATAAGDMDVAVSWTAPSVSDNVDTGLTATLMTSPTTGLVSGDRFPVGVTTVSYDAVDSAGNVAVTCSFDVTVTQTADTTPPVIDNCPADMTVATAAGDMDVAVSWTAPSVSDNVDTGLTATLMTSPTTGLASGDRFPVGVTTVSYDAVDSAGNTAVTCSFEVTVTMTADTTPPVIANCPADMTVATAAGDNDVAVSWTAPSVRDNVDTGLTATLMTSPTTGLVSGDRFPVGVTTVSYDAVDSAGNVAVTCSFDVTVTQTADTTPPVIDNCPADMTVATAAGDMDVAVSWTAPSVRDNVDTGLTATLMTSPTTGLASGDRFPVGVTTVSYDAVDSAGNVAVTCSFDVTVTQTADTTPPVIANCPADMTVATAAGDMDVAVSWTAPSVSDNVDTGLTATLMTSPTTGLASGDRFPVGVTTVSYDAVDSAGNTAVTCSFEVTVTMTADTTPPVIANCPADMTVATAAGDNDVAVSWTAPSVRDNVDTGLTATLMTSPTTGLVSGDRFPVGVTTVSYDAVDSAGNVAVTCSFDVTVTQTADTTPPVIDNCPADMTVATAAGDMDVAVSWTAPSVRDNVDTGLTATLMTSPTTGLASGDRFPVGVTTVSYDAVDSAGNVAVTCSFDVTVTQTADTTPPVIANCPADMTVATAAGDVDVAVSWTAPSVSDNVDTGLTATLMTSPTTGLVSGDRFPVGVTTVSYDAVDSAGNVAVTCSFEVTVTQTADTTAPVIDNCPADMMVATAAGDMDVAVSWTAPSVSDNVDTGLTATLMTSPTTGLASGDRFPVGVTTVSYDAVDSAGNAAVTCSFEVTVTMTPAAEVQPVVDKCPTDLSVEGVTGAATVYVEWDGDVTAQDMQGVTLGRPTGSLGTPLIMQGGGKDGGVFIAGKTETVTYVLSNNVGSVNCEFDVEGIIGVDPVISGCPTMEITQKLGPGQSEVMVTWTDPLGVDEVDGSLTAVVTPQGQGNGAMFGVGTTTVTYTFTDAAGNSATCSFKVTVTQ